MLPNVRSALESSQLFAVHLRSASKGRTHPLQDRPFGVLHCDPEQNPAQICDGLGTSNVTVKLISARSVMIPVVVDGNLQMFPTHIENGYPLTVFVVHRYLG
jgi:hypothetical protein